jgi:hypothetical protein
MGLKEVAPRLTRGAVLLDPTPLAATTPGEIGPATIEAEIVCIRSLGIDALRRSWQAVFRRTPPVALRKDLLGRMLLRPKASKSISRPARSERPPRPKPT